MKDYLHDGMATEPYPEIVFDIDVPPNVVLTMIKQASTNNSPLRIVKEESNTTWKFARLEANGEVAANFKLYVAFTDGSCTLYFTADTAKDSDRLAESVATYLSIIFKGSKVLGPDRNPLINIPGPSDSGAERIATLLQNREAMSVAEISRSLTMLQYTVEVNIRNLLDKGIVGRTPPDVMPRKYFYK